MGVPAKSARGSSKSLPSGSSSSGIGSASSAVTSSGLRCHQQSSRRTSKPRTSHRLWIGTSGIAHVLFSDLANPKMGLLDLGYLGPKSGLLGPIRDLELVQHEDGDTEDGRREVLGDEAHPRCRSARCEMRSQVELGMWHSRAGRGRAGQAFNLGGPDVADGTTAKFIRRGLSRAAQDDQAARTKLLGGAACGSGPGPGANASSPTNELAIRRKAPLDCRTQFKGGLDIPPTHVQFSLLRREHPILDVGLALAGQTCAGRERDRCVCSTRLLLV